MLQKTLTEQAYRDVVTAAGGPHEGLQPGFEVLGLSQGEAQGVLNTMLEELRLEEVSVIALLRGHDGVGVGVGGGE